MVERKCAVKIVKLSCAAALVLPALAAGVVTAAPAAADCVASSGPSLCYEGPNQTGASVALPVVPYPCDDDWLCATGGLSALDSGSSGLNTNRDRPGGSYLD
jgi:hypothetical protein